MLVELLFTIQVAGPAFSTPEKLRSTRQCRSDPDSSDDVVVCGRVDQEQFRLRPLPDLYEKPGLSRAETSLLGDVKIAAETEQANVGGIPSNRIMLRLKLPF